MIKRLFGNYGGAGFFSPRDPFWRVNRELLLLLAGSRALMLELAHPAVAAGVAQHSNFQIDPLGRLFRTVRMMIDITFGDRATALKAAGRTNRCHRDVQGSLHNHTNNLAQEARYSANDPALKLWVLATLIDSILLVHEQFVRPLSSQEKALYYRDAKLLGQLLGIPAEVMPSTFADFNSYWDNILSGPALIVTETALQVKDAIFNARLLGPVLYQASFVGIGLLPDDIRTAFGFSWTTQKTRRLQHLAAFSRQMRSWLPTMLMSHPQATIAEWRLRRQFYHELLQTPAEELHLIDK